MKKAAIIAGCLCLLAAVVFFFSSPTTVTAKGRFGDGLRWELNSRGVLTVSGSGEMTDEGLDFMESPWSKQKELIKKVVIRDGVLSVNEYAFYDCPHLILAELPDSVGSIGHHAFAGCTELSAITMSKGITSIPEALFQDCTSLRKIVIPFRVAAVEPQAFESCTSLTEVVFPYELKLIDRRAFANCHALETAALPEKLQTVGEEAFTSCNALADVALPENVQSVGADAFTDTAFFNNDANWEENVLCSGKCVIAARKDFSGDYTLYDGMRCIADRAFNECGKLTSVTFPDSLKSIGSESFCRCSKLKKITVPESVEKIGSQAFYGCENLKTISLPDGIEDIGVKAFDHTGFKYDKKNWKNDVLYLGRYVLGTNTYFDGDVVIKKGTRGIISGAFMNCSKIRSVTMPDSVKHIGENAFCGCKNIKSIRLSAGLREISCRMLAFCTGLTKLSIPEGVTSVADNAFEGCEGLRDILAPDSVTAFGDSAFLGCSSLTVFTFPQATEKIGDDVFIYCTALTDVCFPGTVTQWNSIEKGKRNETLDSVKIHCESHIHPLSRVDVKPATLTANGRKAYYECGTCGKLFKDPDGRNKTKSSSLTVARIRSVSLSLTTVTYNGKRKKPEVTVRDANGKTLKEDRDYTLSYKNNKNIGNGSVTVSFTGNYTGEKKLGFRIVPPEIGSAEADRKGSSAKLSWEKAEGAKLYGIYTRDSETGKYVRLAVTKNTDYTVKGLDKEKSYTYYIRSGKKIDGEYYFSLKYTSVSF